MAVQTPIHPKRSELVDQRHLIDPSMAGRTADTLVDVDAVIKKDKIREPVNSLPLNGRVGLIAGSHRFENRAGLPEIRVAGHACFSRRDSGKIRLFDGRVAVPAINPVVAHMMFMTELNGLFERSSDTGDVIGLASSTASQMEIAASTSAT